MSHHDQNDLVRVLAFPDVRSVGGRRIPARWEMKPVAKPGSVTMPLKQEYFNERNELVRVLAFSDVRSVGGRRLPTRWEMKPIAKPGNVTTVILKDAAFNQPIDDEVFAAVVWGRVLDWVRQSDSMPLRRVGFGVASTCQAGSPSTGAVPSTLWV